MYSGANSGNLKWNTCNIVLLDTV